MSTQDLPSSDTETIGLDSTEQSESDNHRAYLSDFDALVDRYVEYTLMVLGRQGGSSSTGIGVTTLKQMTKSAVGATDSAIEDQAFQQAMSHLENEGKVYLYKGGKEVKMTNQAIAEGKNMRRELINERNKETGRGVNRILNRG